MHITILLGIRSITILLGIRYPLNRSKRSSQSPSVRYLNTRGIKAAAQEGNLGSSYANFGSSLESLNRPGIF